MKYNITSKIQEHYDLASPYYKGLWGNHIHHGYWVTGKETKEVAAQNLVDLLISKAQIERGARILDVGCGVGGSSIYLAKNFDAKVTGITISPVQVQLATEASEQIKCKHRPKFLVVDANKLNIEGQFDYIWCVEMISHLNQRPNFFKRASQLLKPGGKMCITDWFKEDSLSKALEHKYIYPIEKGMLVSLPSFSEYTKHIEAAGFRMLYYEDMSSKVYKTWDITSSAIKSPALWNLARKHSKEFIEFLKSFKAMRIGFKSGAFRYPIMVLEKK